MVESVTLSVATWEEATLEGQEVTGERRDLTRFEDQSDDDHRRGRLWPEAGTFTPAGLVQVTEINRSKIALRPPPLGRP